MLLDLPDNSLDRLSILAVYILSDYDLSLKEKVWALVGFNKIRTTHSFINCLGFGVVNSLLLGYTVVSPINKY